jgi:AraC-like DNA-binding protein
VVGQLLEGGRERTPSGSHRRIAERAARAMREGLDAPKTIPALARICDTSPTILKESFREVYGEPVHAWYRRMRIMVASRRLLESPDSIAEVALSVGYASIPYRHYVPTDDWQDLIRDKFNAGRIHWFGPTKAEISIVVPLTIKTKGGQR